MCSKKNILSLNYFVSVHIKKVYKYPHDVESTSHALVRPRSHLSAHPVHLDRIVNFIQCLGRGRHSDNMFKSKAV